MNVESGNVESECEASVLKRKRPIAIDRDRNTIKMRNEQQEGKIYGGCMIKTMISKKREVTLNRNELSTEVRQNLKSAATDCMTKRKNLNDEMVYKKKSLWIMAETGREDTVHMRRTKYHVTDSNTLKVTKQIKAMINVTAQQ